MDENTYTISVNDLEPTGGDPSEMKPADGGTPPDLPSGGNGGTPPDMPEGGAGGTPPDGQGGGGSSSSSVTWTGATEITSGGSYSNQTYTSTTANQNALLVNTSSNVTLTNPTVTKSGDGDGGDNSSFYGTNAGVLVKGGSTTTINGGTVTTSASGANGVFSYGGNGGQNGASGDGTTVVISDVTIRTTGDASGGIMTTGGGTTKASNLTITTTGQSSAPIRSDRGGGTVSVSGGSYTSSGLGSPAIYSTADITVENATLTSNLSEGVCIEGQNSVALTNCTLTANNTRTNGNAQFLDAVILYQSMSGDSASGTATFSMTGGKLVNKSGHVFHVTNTNAVINLSGVMIDDSGTGVLLSVCDDGWSGASNVATLNANGQELDGNILVGDDSTLTLNLTGGTTFSGNISGVISNNAGTAVSSEVGTVNVSLDSASKWYLDGDAYISSFSGTATNVITGNHTLYVNGSPLSGTSESDDSSTPSTVVTALNIANSVNNTLIQGTTLNDTITNYGTNVTIDALGGDDFLVNAVDSSVTTAGVGNLINAGDGNDTIYNDHSYRPTLIGGNGNDSIVVSRGHLTYVEGNAGNDTIIGRKVDTITGSDWEIGGYATVLGGEGNDYIDTGYTNSASIDGGEGNDTIYASGNRITINGGEGRNLIGVLPASLDADNACAYIVFNGNTTVEGFKTGWGNGSDTVYIPGDPAGVEFLSGGLTFYNGNDTLALQDVTSTAKVNLYHERRQMLNRGVFIAANDWYSVESGDLTVKSGEEVYFVGTSATHNHGVDFSGISSKLNVTLDTDDNATNASMWINNVYSIRGGAGNTTITGSAKSDTIIAGTGRTTIDGAGGNDRISLGSAAALVKYSSGGGNDSIYGFNANSTISIGGGIYSSATSGSNLILTVGNDKVTLFGAADVTNPHIIGTLASGGTSTTGGGSSSTTSGGGGSSTSDDDKKALFGADDSRSFGTSTTSSVTTSGGGGAYVRPTISGGSSTATTESGGSSTSTTGGGSSTSTTGGGSSTSTTGGGSSTSTVAGTSSSTSTSGKSISQLWRELAGFGTATSTTTTTSGSTTSTTPSGGSTTSTTTSGGSTTSTTTEEEIVIPATIAAEYVYTGGDAVISDYAAGDKIALGTPPTGNTFVNGDFVLSSSSGNLVVENATGKVVEFTDGAGNDFLKAYEASAAGIIDGRGLAGYEVINGSSAGNDAIYAGDGGSQLWGGSGTASDLLVGGGGADVFIGGKNQGADVFNNASSADTVRLNDATLSDIIATAEANGLVAITFNNGNAVAMQSTEPLSAAVVLADGSAYRYNHAARTWQSA